MSYWDTSALVKLYAKEPDSATFEQYTRNSPTRPTTSRIALYEAQATFIRKEAEGTLKANMAQTLYGEFVQDVAAGEARIIELGADVEREYGQVLDSCYHRSVPILLRTLDALHLASARVAAETEIVATDKRMRDAAKLLGFSVFPA